MFSIVTVASSTRMPTASASPPSVITLIVSPVAASSATEVRIASGIEIMMMSVERQLPRKMRIMSPVSAAATTPSKMTDDTAAFTNLDWSPTVTRRRLSGRVSRNFGSSALTPAITSRVEAEPVLRIVIKTAFEPSTRTMLVCGGLPSWTLATSWM